MSQEVDERVVEMRFDNAQFEKNVHQTMQSLEQLNDSLRLDGAEKGFEKISDASAKVDFDEMQGALDNLSGKFSAVEVMGVAALSHITRQAVDTGERLVKSLSLDQVTSGWNKYAQKTASVQTIMNATGKSIAKVNGYLEKLMWFSDETSYGFTDMTSALSTLTSTGGSIEKMIPMIMGMANATAYAGKGAAEFQRVIYNLAQSYGTGAIQLIDWKSVEQAGVASQQLKQLLIDTGVELGKIKKGAVTTGSFDNSLQKKWADREVMEKAFGKYAEFAEAVKAELDANPNKYHGQASLAIEAISDQYDEVTVKAFKAAQEAKSFSEAVDATKDAVSSGWMETFDILFGNYDEAKGFWSDLAEEFWNMFAGGAAGWNNWLKNAFDSGLDQLLGTEGFGEAGDNYTNLLQKALVNQGLLSEEGIEEAGSFQKALEESGVTAQQLYEVLGEAADYYHQRAAMSDEELDKLGFDRGKVDALANAYDSMAEKIQNGSVNLDDLAGKMNQLSGREHFFNGILNVLEGINSVLSPIRDGFGDVFMTDGSPLYNFLKGFDELTGKMALSEETAEKVQKVFTGVFRVLSIGLKGVTTVGKTAFMILGKLLDLLSPMGDLLLNIGSYIGNLLTWVDLSLGQAESLSDVLGILVGAVAALVSPIADVVKGVKTLVRGGNMEEAKKQFGAFGTVVDAVGSVLDKFKIDSVSAGNVIGTAFQLLGGILLGAFEGVGALIARVFNGFKGAGDTVSEFADSKVPLLKNIRDVVLSLPEKAEKALADFGGTLTGIMSSISGACRNALGAVKDFFNLQDGVDIYRLLALIDVGALAAAIYGATVLLKKASDNFKKTLANPIGDFFNSLTGAVNTWTKANTTNNLATAAKAIATAVALISGSMYLLAKIDDPMRAVQALASVISELFSMVVALKVLAATDLTGLDTAKLIGTVVAISIGMAALTNTVAKLGKMDAAQAEKSVEAVGHIAAMLAGMTGLLALFNKQLGGVKGAGGFVAAAAAVDMIALALIPLAKAEANGLDIDGAVEAINGVAIAMSILTVAAGFAQKLAGKADMSTLDKIIKYLVKLGGMLVAINAMGTALLMAAGAVAIFASLGDRMMNGIRGAGLVVSGIAALLVLMANTKVNPLRMKMGAESMVIASASLLVMAAAVKQMGKAMGTDAGGAGMAGVSLMLIGLAGALYLLGKQAPESTAAAVAMVAMGAAMIEMALAIKMLADVDFVDIVKSVFSLAAALGVLIAGCWGLGFVSANLASAAGACLMLATALLILTPAFKGLASLTAGEAFAGVIGTIGIMLGLFAVGAITPVAAGMVVFSACLISLGKAFSAFAGGIIKLSIAAAILTVLSAFAGPLREVIVNAADDIEAALTAILTAICNTINNCAEPIGAALLTLCKVLIQTVIDLIGWAWSGEGGEGNGIEGALEELWSQFVEWLGEKKDEAGELIGKQLNPANWFTVKGGLLGSLLDSADTAADEREMTEYGTYMAEGLANGLTGPESTNVVTGGIATLCSTVETFFRNFWGIHSPSTRMADLSEYIPEGFKEGLTGTDGTAAIGDGISGMLDSAGSWLDKLFPGLLNKAKNYGSQFQNALLSGSEYQGMPGFDNWYKEEMQAYRVKQPGGKTGLTTEDLDADIKKDRDDDGNKKPTTTGKKKGSSGTKKTMAQQIEEKYKPKLEANKAAREALDSEYELWQTENQYSADEDTLLAKKMENAAAEIANQTERVAIAQAKYDEMLKRWGADKTETKEAYANLLSEKTSLAKLQADQYTGLFEDITKRYDTDLDTLEKEYNLWTAQNSNTASKLDKIDRETEYQKDELELKQKKEAKAKEQWETLRKEYGESDLRTKEAWNDYLDAQTESLQLQNDIAKQSLNKLDAQLSIIKDEQSRMQSRMDLLTSVYDDGSIADRAEAYKQAVEEYGENSAEARKAKYRGITTSILGTVSALQNMNAELQKTAELQDILKKGYTLDADGNRVDLSDDERKGYEDQLLSARSSMVSFAGALADAMNLDDSGKKLVVKLANAIQKNWVPISNAFTEVWKKASEAMGEEMSGTLERVFGAAFSEEGMEIGTEFLSAITSAMQGDYAGALVSAATAIIDLMSTEMGQQLLQETGTLMMGFVSKLQNRAGQVQNALTGSGGLLTMLSQLGTAGGGAAITIGGIGKALGGLGASILAVLPELLIVVGIIAAIAALIGGIAWFISSRKKEKATGAKDVGSEIDKGISDGVKEDAPIVDDAVSDMTENAMDIAKGALGTISKVMGDDYEYTPQIVPVVDLTNVLEGADEIDNAFAATRSLSLDGDVSRNLANKIDAEVQLQNGLKSAGNEDTLRAINALAGHMDGVAESIKGMSVTINGRKAIGYIDDRMGRLTAAKVK